MRPPARALAVLAAMFALLGAAGSSSALAATATWRLAPVSAPAGPPGEPTAGSVALGRVGEISFYSPNRGLLIDEGSPGTNGCTTTSSTVVVPCGLYAYNGEGWHLLSEVCGAEDGRIAWASAEEFWTISTQRPGQYTGIEAKQKQDVSLCRFKQEEGASRSFKVADSYAMPLGLPDSYEQMHAAACLTPDDCWFGGELGTAPNNGAFHLHWNGSTVTAVYSPQDHAVYSMALSDQSTLFESVKLSTGSYESEDPQHPAVLHQIEPFGANPESPFHDVFMPDSSCETGACPPLPNYEGDGPVTLGNLAPFALGGDYLPSEAGSGAAHQLWALAGAEEPGSEPHPIVMRYAQGEWTQFPEIEKKLGEQQQVGLNSRGVDGVVAGVAAEPGSAAWVSLASSDEQAHVDRLQAEGGRGAKGEGTITGEETLGAEQGLAKPGSAGAITCPARNDCWMATSRGWLFHLTEEPERPQLTQVYNRPQDFYPLDNEGFAEVITSRPPDGGIPQLPPIEAPPEESIALVSKLPTATKPQASVRRTVKPLVSGVSSRVVDRYTLELSFRLTVRGRVQLLAERKGRSVARTAMRTLPKGKHTLTLRLNPRRWPNKLDLKATPLEALPTVESKLPSGQTVAPPLGSNTVST